MDVFPELNSGLKMAHNKALHRTAIPLRSIAAGELDRYLWGYLKTTVKEVCESLWFIFG